MRQIWRCPRCGASNVEQFLVGYQPIFCVYCKGEFRHDQVDFIQDFDNSKDCPGQLSLLGDWS